MLVSVTGRHCPLESDSLRCSYTANSASPTTWSISGTPISLCWPASLAFRHRSVRYPRIFAPTTWFSLLRTLRRHMWLDQGSERDEGPPPSCFRLETALQTKPWGRVRRHDAEDSPECGHLSGRFLSTSSFTRLRTSLIVCRLSSQIPSRTLPTF